MNREQKTAVIDEIAADIDQSAAIFAVDYRGMTVAQAAELRGKLRDADATLRVVKNTLTKRAADQAGAGALIGLLEGPSALTFVNGDAATAAKAVADFSKATGLLPFKGGLMDGASLGAEQIAAIAKLPSRDMLNAQLVNIVASPLTGLVTSLSNLISGLARQLSQVAEKKESGEIPAGVAATLAAAQPVAEATDEPAQAEPEAQGETAPEAEAAAEPAAQPVADTTSDTDDEKE